MTRKSTKLPRIFIASVIVLIGACTNNEARPAASNDVAALSNFINIQVPVKSAQWEIFGTPEYTGGVPGPTDFMTLVAELEPERNWLNDRQEPTGTTYVAPEAARPWLSAYFRALLEKNRNSSVDLSAQANCKKYSTTIKKSGRVVDGFMCGNSGRLLMYLTLSPAS